MRRTVKILLSGIFAIAFLYFGLSGKRVNAISSGPDPGLTGAPGEATCSACHSGGPMTGTLAITGVPANYTADQEYTITVTLTQAARQRYGFEATVIDNAGNRAGTLIVSDNARTQLITGTIGSNQRTYIQHTLTGTAPSGTGQGAWIFRWRAPAAATGAVTFYVAGNAANGDFTTFGDSIYTTSAASQPMTQPTPTPTPTPRPFVSVSAASFQQGQPLPANSIAAGFGITGATGFFVPAAGQPLPTELGETIVRVVDSAGGERNAQLFFVGEQQVNYVIPAETVNGTAQVRVIRGGQTVAQGTIQVAALSPGIFTANTSGTGVAAAQIFRIRANGEQVFEQVAQLNGSTFEAIPIDFGPEGDQIFLVLYGTGFRTNSGTAGATASVGGVASQVLYASVAPNFVGLDQANLTLSRTLIGRGGVDVSFTVDGQTANTVTVAFK